MSDQKQRTPEEIQQDLHRELGQVLKSGTITFDKSKVNYKRYRKIRWFFAKVFLHIFFWDILLNRPILIFFRREPMPRWRKLSQNFRHLAIEMGGVLIKLGQFMSIQVDVLPPAVTEELAGLRDEIPAVDFSEVLPQIEADFDQPISDLFEWISPTPLGAASLGQTHLAHLADTGQEVVVKVLRPGIDVLVETDLAAIALALRWLKLYKRISSRVDLDWLAQEFATVTGAELDFRAEGKNAERIAADFADDPQVYIPKVYWDYSAARTLTLENVGYIKISDLSEIEAVGISRAEVAKKFYNIYMQQIFVTNFVHADPHPGNVFIRPLPVPAEIEAGITEFKPNDLVSHQENRPFQIVFIDFGMVAIIPDRLRKALRDYIIGFGTRDSYKIVQSFVDAGVLLPGADVKRLEELHDALFDRFWGMRVGQINEMAFSEANYFFREYQDLIRDMPVQIQVDMLFVMRAVGILSGMSTNLDINFDPWAETIPFAEKMAKDEVQQNWQGWLQEIVQFGQLLYKLPTQTERLLTQAQRGDLMVKTALAPDARKATQRLERSVNRLSWMVVATGLLISGTNLRAAGEDQTLGTFLLVGAFGAFIWGVLRRG